MKPLFQKILFLLFVLVSFKTSASSIQEADQFYFKGNFDAAEKIYLELEEESQSANFYYNLGNINYYQGDLAQALLYYERAKLFDPRDTDLRANIDYLRKKLSPGWSSASDLQIFLKKIFVWNEILKLDEAEYLLIFLNLIFCLLLLLKFFKRHIPKKSLLGFVLLLLVLQSLAFWNKLYWSQENHWGIALKDDLEVYPNFIESDKVIFEIPLGSKIHLLQKQELEEKQVWYQIELTDQKKAWIRSEGLGVI